MRRSVAWISWTAASAVASTLMCAKPTEIVVDVYSDVSCATHPQFGFVGASELHALAESSPSAVTTNCVANERVGRVVVHPSGDKDDRIAFQVVTRSDGQDPAQCTSATHYQGCIVARRQLRFASHESTQVTVNLRESCRDRPCDDEQTCVRGACVSAVLPDTCIGGACDESVFGDGVSADAGAPDGVAPRPQPPWGTYTAALDVLPCPLEGALVVNTAEDEPSTGATLTSPDRAGPTLSFREAMEIAANRGLPTRQTIAFDPAVFPEDRETVIHLDARPFATPQSVCIDGRRRGVVFEWPLGLTDSTCPMCIWQLFGDSLEVGLTLRNVPRSQTIGETAQAAGCYFDATYIAISVVGGTIGPGNVFKNATWAVQTQISGTKRPITIHDNFFNYDPRTGSALPGRVPLLMFVPADVHHNVFASTEVLLNVTTSNTAPASDPVAAIHDNWFGVDKTGTVIQKSAIALEVIGPALIATNVIRGQTVAIYASPDNQVHITRNVISGNDQGIVPFGAGTPAAPPVIDPIAAQDGSSTTKITGTCPGMGTVELFSDPGDQGETFLAEVLCGGAFAFTADVPKLAAGRRVTGTFTPPAGKATSAFSSPQVVP